ncbi:CRISPR-associated helicase/endonuclease Cas3 [Pseudoalteromonas sp. NC201]|uniref:CRISPR-associated helicase/endonuclease Cas3 n=1 Tax=Pseudoalteromonas sp. NC201 TaxID=1514074 RepID=UPI000C7A3E36|nr:CRISPR-associated helicase/endonuclease Cas3 [Pseudoalteromonas sp. NC201]AUJ72261.1 CRISPR-associated endonuclease/helicase Cas3 [Pseudoalteromonas sp. NC201]
MTDLNSLMFKYWGKARKPLEIDYCMSEINGESLQDIVERHPGVNSVDHLKALASKKGWQIARQGETFHRYHLLVFHSLDVAAVALTYLDLNKQFTQDLAEFLGLTIPQLKSLVGFFVAIHDLGKFASAFQNLAEFYDSNLSQGKSKEPYSAKDARHDGLGHHFWKMCLKQLKENNISAALHEALKKLGTVRIILNAVFGHHGDPVVAGEFGRKDKDYCIDENYCACIEFIQLSLEMFASNFPVEKFADTLWRKHLRYASWHINGICILADWLGSDTEYFAYQSQSMAIDAYWQKALKKSHNALLDRQLTGNVEVSPYDSVKKHFGFDTPTPLQAFAEQVPVGSSPQLFILEDVTGAGKTEAALILIHRLMYAGAADGFYFGLPTMATSSAMYHRIAKHYLQMMSIDGKKASLVLAQGASMMEEAYQDSLIYNQLPDIEYGNSDSTASQACHVWYADSKKKALLAKAGVGTIDQPLLSILPSKHSALRVHGLVRKILVLDEVHAADQYMFTMLEDLLRVHLRFGGSVILLTATLPHERRNRLCNIWQEELGLEHVENIQNSEFPLVTGIDQQGKLKEQPVGSLSRNQKSVRVDFIHSEQDCIDEILKRAKRGEAVVWIRNTVTDAQNAYALLAEHYPQEHIILFHSRFALYDRKQKEKQVLSKFGKESGPEQRAGKILVSTQVFQESIDADSDFMISDICPIDDLIQRAGRLKRHIRDANGNYNDKLKEDERPPALLKVFCPEWQNEPETDWLHKGHSGTAAVYRSSAIIWLTQKVLREKGGMYLPEKARDLVEGVYSQMALNTRPSNLDCHHSEYRAREQTMENTAKQLKLEWDKGYSREAGKVWLGEELEINTRYSDRVNIQVVMLKLTEGEELTFYADGLAKKHLLQHSEIRVDEESIAKKLAPVPKEYSEQLESLFERYPSLKYKRFWLQGSDENYLYEDSKGLIQKESP